MKKELWKKVKGYPNYIVSNMGKVKFVARRKPTFKRPSNYRGYLRIAIWKNNKPYKVGVHKLVALAFVDGYFKGAQVNHKNFDKSDNRAENLEWVTPSQNYYYSMERRSLATRGENNCKSKLKDEDIIKIRKLRKKGTTLVALSKKFGVSYENIDYIVRGLTWKHIPL